MEDSKAHSGVRPLSLLALVLGLATATICLISLSVLIGQVDNIREELNQEMFVFKQETDDLWSIMITHSGRAKRQGYDISPETFVPGNAGSASYGQPTGGYETSKSPNGYEQPAASNGYESPTVKGPVPVGERSGFFKPAHPPSTSYCQCDQITCPPGPPGEPGEDGFDGEEGSDGEPGEAALDMPAQIQQYDKCFHCPAGMPGPQDKFILYSTNPGLFHDHWVDRACAECEGLEASRDGSPGFPGSLGAEGPQGERGPPGLVGLPGDDVRHVIGGKGPKGDRGSIGPIGDPGEPGLAGPIGPIGEMGDRGSAGTDGKDGDIGPPGEHGDIGLPGSDGSYCPCPSRTQLMRQGEQPMKEPKEHPKEEPKEQTKEQTIPVLRPGAIVASNPYRRMRFV